MADQDPLETMDPQDSLDLKEREVGNTTRALFNLLPHMPILGSSNSTAKKDMMLEVQTNGDTII